MQQTKITDLCGKCGYNWTRCICNNAIPVYYQPASHVNLNEEILHISPPDDKYDIQKRKSDLYWKEWKEILDSRSKEETDEKTTG